MMDYNFLKRHVILVSLIGVALVLAVSVVENLDELRCGNLNGFAESLAQHGFAGVLGVTVGVAIVMLMAYKPRPPRQ